MRKIKLESWKEKDQQGKDVDVDLIFALNILLNSKDPKDMPRGLDKFRLFNRLSKAFDKAKKEKVLVLEEGDYSFLKKTVESDVPSAWGSNPDMAKAIESFMEAGPEE